MKPVRYSATLAVKLEPRTRRAVEQLAEQEKLSLGEATRELLDEGIRARAVRVILG